MVYRIYDKTLRVPLNQILGLASIFKTQVQQYVVEFCKCFRALAMSDSQLLCRCLNYTIEFVSIAKPLPPVCQILTAANFTDYPEIDTAL